MGLIKVISARVLTENFTSLGLVWLTEKFLLGILEVQLQFTNNLNSFCGKKRRFQLCRDSSSTRARISAQSIAFFFHRKILNHLKINRCFHYLHSKKSLSIVKLRSFQNASIEIKHIPFVYQQNLLPVTKLICEMQKENIFSNERFFLL